jgi:hypothetical protein
VRIFSAKGRQSCEQGKIDPEHAVTLLGDHALRIDLKRERDLAMEEALVDFDGEDLERGAFAGGFLEWLAGASDAEETRSGVDDDLATVDASELDASDNLVPAAVDIDGRSPAFGATGVMLDS